VTIQKLGDCIEKLNEEGQKLFFSGITARQAQTTSLCKKHVNCLDDPGEGVYYITDQLLAPSLQRRRIIAACETSCCTE
jgi:hypothetical protein